ncbi:MAG: NADH/ubiquinone/plastoquinone (complex I) [Phycisphaerae bacterium]|nr:NADH/ubiquinone/plastoquinone (complex I) [Phycisphaerae bacterium]
MTTWLPLFVILPLAAGFLTPLAGRRPGESGGAARGLALLVGAVLLAGSIALLGSEPAVYWIGGWPGADRPSVGLSLVCDGLTQMLLVTVNAIAFCALLYSWSYIQRYTGRALYYCLFLLMLAGMNAVVLAGDLFNVFVFMEVAVICSYALVAFGVERAELEAAFKYVVLGSVSSLFVLLGIALIYNLTGQLNMALVAERLGALGTERGPAVWLAAGCFIMGFGLKAAMVPFHAWLPDAHPSAPAPISAMLSGVVIKAVGVYVVCRILFNVFGLNTPAGALYANVLIVLGTLSMVIGVFLAIGQWDFKRLLAYHSISQMGYVFLAVGVGAAVLATDGPRPIAALAIFGGLFHLVNHATFKSLLFLCSGSAEYAAGTRDLHELGGLKYTMPTTAGCCRVAALSIAGVPPFNGFWSKLIIVVATAMAGYWILAALAAFVSFMTLLSFLKVQRYALEGPPPERIRAIHETPVPMRLAMIGLATACVLLGVLVPLHRARLIDPATRTLTEPRLYVERFRPPDQPHMGTTWAAAVKELQP